LAPARGIGFEIIEELAPRPGEMIVHKRRYSCFLGTELELLLKSLRSTPS
jgi:nicotinamidase-related amidase